MKAGWWLLGGALLLGAGYASRGRIAGAMLEVLERLEGREHRAYIDTAGFWTIGIGHKILPSETAKYVGTPVVIDGRKRGSVVISDDEIDRLAQQDTAKAAAAVDQNVRVPINGNQRAALVSFSFNVGVGAFKGSTLLKKLNAGDFAGAAAEFLRWNKETKDGVAVENAGLTARRLAEQTMFTSSNVA